MNGNSRSFLQKPNIYDIDTKYIAAYSAFTYL